MKTWYTDNIGVDFEYICAAENETVTKAEDLPSDECHPTSPMINQHWLR